MRLIAAVLLVPIGFGTKHYVGYGEEWVNHYAGGVLYVVFGCLIGGMFTRTAGPVCVAMVVLGLTCLVEVSQLWQPATLESLRQTRVGSAALGTSFDWYDFPHYGLGAVLGSGLLKMLSGEQADGIPKAG